MAGINEGQAERTACVSSGSPPHPRTALPVSVAFCPFSLCDFSGRHRAHGFLTHVTADDQLRSDVSSFALKQL